MSSNGYFRKARSGKLAESTLYLEGNAYIVIGVDKHRIEYELSTSSACGLVPSLLILYGPKSLLSEASRKRHVKLEIWGVQFRTPVFRYCAPDSLSVEAAPLFKLIAHAAQHD
jgi:hypothetical protein